MQSSIQMNRCRMDALLLIPPRALRARHHCPARICGLRWSATSTVGYRSDAQVRIAVAANTAKVALLPTRLTPPSTQSEEDCFQHARGYRAALVGDAGGVDERT